MKESFKLGGIVRYGASESEALNRAVISNQVVNEGVKSILAAFADVKSCKITNMFLLTGFQMPEGVSDIKELKFSDIKDFIALQAFTGNNQVRNADGSMDMRVYTSNEPPYEMTSISTIPANRANTENVFNACALVLGGDEHQSSTTAEGQYIPTGNESLFSIALFPNEVVKNNTDNFVVLWYIRVE